MSTNDFEQTTPLPVGDDETKPQPYFADAPIEDQKTSANTDMNTEADTNTCADTEAEAPDASTAWTGAAAGAAAASATSTPASEHTFEPQNTPIVPPAHVWSAEDVKEAPYRGVRIGQLLWACIIIFTAIALIAMAFVKAANLALVAIGTLAIMGVLLIIIAGVSTVMTHKKR